MRRHVIITLMAGTLLATACGQAEQIQDTAGAGREQTSGPRSAAADDFLTAAESAAEARARANIEPMDDFLSAAESAAEARVRTGATLVAVGDYSTLTGTWEGPSIDDSEDPSWIVHAAFDEEPDARGIIGEATWFSGDGTALCDVDLRANLADDPAYVVEEFVTADHTERDVCRNGFVELTLLDDDVLRYTFDPRTPNPQTLELSRTEG